MSDLSAFASREAYIQRVLVISAASLSICSGIACLVWWFVVPWWNQYQANRLARKQREAGGPPGQPPPRRLKRIRQFRHDLTISLIIMDLIKAIILITYPIRFLHTHELNMDVYASFCDGVGFLVVATMQASDFAVLALAIHTALLIFYPGFTGGLYRFRYYIYIIFFFILPLAIAAIGLVGDSGYTFFSSWCYLVVQPVWYSLVLSWIPRLVIMVLIIIIYCSIFIYVKLHMYHVSKAILQASSGQHRESDIDINITYVHSHERAIQRIKRILGLPKRASRRMWRNIKIGLSYLPGLGSLNPVLETQHSPQGPIEMDAAYPTPNLNEDFQAQINRENIERFNHRRSIIERQVNSIFIYPITYVLLYIFPLIQQCLHYVEHSKNPNSDDRVETVFWLAVVASWMKPFNCFVDTTVFVIREGAIPCLSPRHNMQKKLEKRSFMQQPDFTQGSTSDSSGGGPLPSAAVPIVPVEGTPNRLDEFYLGGDAEIDFIIPNSQRTGLVDEENYDIDHNRTGPAALHRRDPFFQDSHTTQLPWFQKAYHMMGNVLIMAPLHTVHNLFHHHDQRPRSSEPDASLLQKSHKKDSAQSTKTQVRAPSESQIRSSLDWSHLPTSSHDTTTTITEDRNPVSSEPFENPGLQHEGNNDNTKNNANNHSSNSSNNSPGKKMSRFKRASTMPAPPPIKHSQRVSTFQSPRHQSAAAGQQRPGSEGAPEGISSGFRAGPAAATNRNDNDRDETSNEEMGLKEFLAML